MTTSEETTDATLDGFYEALLDDDAEALYERAPCGYVSAAPDGTIIKVNETFLAWTRHRHQDLVGRKSFVDLLTAGGRIYHETHYRPLLEMQGKVREIALDLVCGDGARLPALINSVLERDDRGHPIVIRTAVFDATERRQYERELLGAKRDAEEAEARARVLAETLQRTLLPPALPQITGLDLAAAYRPAGSGDEVGGDFYDVFRGDSGAWFIAVGDVRGKGVKAAAVTGLARHTLRAAAVGNPEPCDVLSVLNEVVLGAEDARFLTIALIRLCEEEGGWATTIALGGHPHPLVCRPGEPPRPVGNPGPLIGVFESPVFDDAELLLEPGDLMVIYTDGVTEARRGDAFFGETRLSAALAEHPGSASEATDRILAEVTEFQGGRFRDDIVVLAAHVPKP